ncbi:Trifunctional NAD biosynthesis/regulator protein NadR [Raoultella terrigena]|uniref:Trifunctional NAD biosynthesis/regulator protein NadR n=1 Tax=Raoultella terrigena TaxID=577 RepID=A0A3P8JS88_RAOTE|nr:Trifunctional NAD biosynthesis/regulator protein NadR [Raoultella terrigena]
MSSRAGKKAVGVVFGKFYPLHTGHIYLIQRACSQVDELHIIMGYDDTRDRQLFEESAMSQQPTVPDRLRWLLQTFKYQKNIRIHAFNEEGMEPYPHGWDVWSRGSRAFMDEKGIQPKLDLYLRRVRRPAVSGAPGDRNGTDRS